MTGEETRPAIVTIPDFGRARFYLWTVTHVASSDRPPDEFKIQLILPGQARGDRGTLECDSPPTFLLGYSPDFGVFVAWEAAMHADFSFSKAVQVPEGLLSEARRTGWAVAAPRSIRQANGYKEVRVACTSGNLLHFMKQSYLADAQRLNGNDREAFFLVNTPNIGTAPTTTTPAKPAKTIRRRIALERLERDQRFALLVRKQYDFACAVCSTQLNIAEGAHIIPACEPKGVDEVWNGVSLCPNHHKLFDAKVYVVRPTLEIVIDSHAIEFFMECKRSNGLDELLIRYSGCQIRRPAFFERDSELTARMKRALEVRMASAAL
ncbi:HNH endonuclease [Sorangium sp. So ce1014]|uniref:HNH endonuclease n=1 Tax=Sorangium sp. So ce1014 TaxID=3133326 RepID=UPI003F5DE5E5